MAEADALLAEMDGGGPAPDAFTLASLISGHGAAAAAAAAFAADAAASQGRSGLGLGGRPRGSAGGGGGPRAALGRARALFHRACRAAAAGEMASDAAVLNGYLGACVKAGARLRLHPSTLPNIFFKK